MTEGSADKRKVLICSFLILFATIFTDSTIAQTKVKTAINQPVLGHRTAKILTVDKLQFKDLNRNGKLDKYEDWRLPSEVRSRDLISKMSVEEKVGFMLISTTRMKNHWSFGAPKTKDPITSDFNEEDLVAETNMFTRQPLPVPLMNAAPLKLLHNFIFAILFYGQTYLQE